MHHARSDQNRGASDHVGGIEPAYPKPNRRFLKGDRTLIGAATGPPRTVSGSLSGTRRRDTPGFYGHDRRIPGHMDWLAEDAVSERTRLLIPFPTWIAVPRPQKGQGSRGDRRQIPCTAEQGIFSAVQGKESAYQGNRSAHQGSRRQQGSTCACCGRITSQGR